MAFDAKQWRLDNADEIKAKKAAKYQENKEKIKAKQRAYTAANKAEVSKRAAERYRAKNPNPAPTGKVPFTEKVCPKCGVLKVRTEYYKKLTSRSYACKACTDIQTKAHKATNPKKHLEYANKSRKLRYNRDDEYRSKIAEQKKAARDARKDEINGTRRERYLNDKDYRAAVLARNSSRLTDRQPVWACTVEIREIYKNCPEGFHVDHIIPLRHPLVSGLHVANNLQHLSATENQGKYNKFEI